MSFSTRFIPRIYRDRENIEINEYNFLLTKEIQRNHNAILILATVARAIIAHLKSKVSKIRFTIIARLN